MKKIPLRNIKRKIIAYTLVDDENFERLNQWKWHMGSRGYSIRSHYYAKENKWKVVRMATEVMKISGNWKANKLIDHINRNKLDNRKCNLRMVTASQNAINSKMFSTNTSGYRGVSFQPKANLSNPWTAYMHFSGKKMHLGYYKTKTEAAKAYDNKAIELYGKFARLNFRKNVEVYIEV